MAEPIRIDGRSLTLEQVGQVARGEAPVELADHARTRVRATRDVVHQMIVSGETVYGLNTGFGSLRDVRIEDERLADLQLNLIRSHCAGFGEALPAPTVRALLLLRANVLAAGHSGVRDSLIDALLAMLRHDVLPVVPSQGSVGASGDLAPLAHLALPLLGEGEVDLRGERLPAKAALEREGLAPVRLEAKEGLALINGTQLMTAIGTLVVLEARELVTAADIVGALTLDALLGTDRAFEARIADLRRHEGHRRSAANLRALLKGSELMRSHRSCERVQDSYSLRCMPQVHGSVRDALDHVASTLAIEVNAVTDNPLVFPDDRTMVSGGNFHGSPVALALDYLTSALTVLASISERRLERLVNPDLSGLGKYPFLTPGAGLNSGLMIAQVTAAALVSESKVLAHPASVDSIPTSANQEDHVSMGPIAARQCEAVLGHATGVLGIELIGGCQAIDLRAPLTTSEPLQAVVRAVRPRIPTLERDRVLSGDIATAAALVGGGALRRAAEPTAGTLY